VQHAYGLDIPQNLDEACVPDRTALLVYDMQVGIVSQIADGAEITRRVVQVRDAARAGGFRVFYTRHMTLPNRASGVSQLRTAMAWQRTTDVAEVRSSFPQGSPRYQLVPELEPGPDEVVFDKIAMSCFVGTPLDVALRDCRIDTFAIAGIALEVGIEPTVRHAMDLGYLPIIVTDACGGGNPAAAKRSLDALEFAGGSLQTDTATICDLLRAQTT
jgi:nicotinamidase-related amidase